MYFPCLKTSQHWDPWDWSQNMTLHLLTLTHHIKYIHVLYMSYSVGHLLLVYIWGYFVVLIYMPCLPYTPSSLHLVSVVWALPSGSIHPSTLEKSTAWREQCYTKRLRTWMFWSSKGFPCTYIVLEPSLKVSTLLILWHLLQYRYTLSKPGSNSVHPFIVQWQVLQVEKFCSKHTMNTTTVLPSVKSNIRQSLFRHLLFSDKKEFIFCFLPKVRIVE